MRLPSSRVLRPLRTRLGASIAIALAVNVVLAGAYVWSRGGQTTYVSVEAYGAAYTTHIDGRMTMRTTLAGPESGGISLTLFEGGTVPSMPEPFGIDRVRVVSVPDGAVLLDETFSSGSDALSGWRIQAGAFDVRDGILTTKSGNAKIAYDAPQWRDYRVDLTLRNVPSITVAMRVQGDGAVEYAARPFRNLDNRLSVIEGGKPVQGVPGPTLEPRRTESMRAMVAMTLRPYPLLMAALLAGIVVVGALQFAPADRLLARAVLPPWLPWALAAGVTVTAFLFTARLMLDQLEAVPHVPDELSYIFQAKVFAQGRLYAPAPAANVLDAFTISNPSPIVVHDGKWASIYPFGHPLVLAIGGLFRSMWIIPPLVGAACVALVFVTGRRLYGARAGLLAAALFAGSPFFLMNAASYMSHNTTALFVLASLALLAYADRRPVLFPLLAGVALGLVFNTRQLSGVALIPPFAVFLATFPLQRGMRIIGLKQVGAFAAGGALMLLAYLAYRYLTTGDALIQETVQGGADTFGFGGGHSTAAGMANNQTQLAFLVLVLNNWPLYVGLSFVLLPFVLGTRSRWDWFFLIAATALMAAYTWFHYHGVMYGPRFWYETMPFLMLLAGRGAELAAGFLTAAASRASARLGLARARARWAGAGLVYGLAVVLLVAGTRSWMFGEGGNWRIGFVPSRAEELRGFNGIDATLVSRLESADLSNALVFVDDCPSWQCYGNVFWMNSPWLDGDVVLAKSDPETNAAVLQAYPDRRVYEASFTPYILNQDLSTLTVYNVPGRQGDDAPLARDVPLPTPEASPTPDAASVRQRDQRRISDLNGIARALEAYRLRHGAYPRTSNVQSLCRYEADVGCALKEQLDPLPADPNPDAVYQYVSDGDGYTLFARLEDLAPASSCPATLPADLGDPARLYCVTETFGRASTP